MWHGAAHCDETRGTSSTGISNVITPVVSVSWLFQAVTHRSSCCGCQGLLPLPAWNAGAKYAGDSLARSSGKQLQPAGLGGGEKGSCLSWKNWWHFDDERLICPGGQLLALLSTAHFSCLSLSVFLQVHVNLLILEARMQAELLYALQAITQYMIS